MAGLVCYATTADIAVTAATAKTILQVVAASNHRVRVLQWAVFVKATTGTEPAAKVRMLRQTTAGTMSALTPVKADNAIGDTIQTTAQHTATVEPTAGDVLVNATAVPQGGLIETVPFGQDIMIDTAGRIGIEVTASVAGTASAWIKYEE